MKHLIKYNESVYEDDLREVEDLFQEYADEYLLQKAKSVRALSQSRTEENEYAIELFTGDGDWLKRNNPFPYFEYSVGEMIYAPAIVVVIYLNDAPFEGQPYARLVCRIIRDMRTFIQRLKSIGYNAEFVKKDKSTNYPNTDLLDRLMDDGQLQINIFL